MSVTWEYLAAEQGGIIRFHQLVQAGVSRRQRERLLACGLLVRLSPGVYCVPAPGDPWLRELRVTLAQAGPAAVVWRRSAARLWRLDGLDTNTTVEVAVGAGGRRGDPRVARVGRALDVVNESGFAVTSIAQTLVDLGPVVGPDLVERALEDGLRRGTVTLADLRRLAAVAPGASRVLRSVLARRPAGSPATESDAETLFVQLVRRGGLPEPLRQFTMVVRGRLVRLDFAWPTPRLAAEVDGVRFHGPETFGRDLRRQNAIILGGWQVLRFTWEDVARYPDQVIETLWDGLS